MDTLYRYRARVTAVYDGDTVTADIDLGFHTWIRGEKFRLYGIDTPELRGATKAAGLQSRDALRARILGRDLVIRTIADGKEKYGRYLAQLFLDDEDINAWMVSQGHAVPYFP